MLFRSFLDGVGGARADQRIVVDQAVEHNGEQLGGLEGIYRDLLEAADRTSVVPAAP